MSEQEKLPKLNKIVGLIGHPFRLLSEKGVERLKTSYDYWKKHKTNFMFSEKDGVFKRWDRETKAWVDDDKNNYWYKDEKTGKNRSYISVGTEYLIEFIGETNIEVYAGGLINKSVKKCAIELTGNQNFGQVKMLFDKLTEIEAMGKKRTGVFVEMYKDGLRYNFKYHSDYVKDEGETPSPTQSQPKISLKLEPDEKPMSEDLKNAVEALKTEEYKNYTKEQIKQILTAPANGINATSEEADKILQESFEDRV